MLYLKGILMTSIIMYFSTVVFMPNILLTEILVSMPQ